MKDETYLTTWEIEIDASSPESAALIAREYQEDPQTLATIFRVVVSEEIKLN